jgi:hypothetical protein
LCALLTAVCACACHACVVCCVRRRVHACVAVRCACASGGRRTAGKYGTAPHAEEPWSLQAYQKRVYALRDTYATGLKGTTIDNPAWDAAVCGVLGALSRLLGKKPQHVPNSYFDKTGPTQGLGQTCNERVVCRVVSSRVCG